MSNSKEFDMVVTKNKDGEALAEPITVRSTAILTDTSLSIVSADGETSVEIDRENHPEWTTVEDATAWFLEFLEGTR